jgi:hypothetical protein
MRARAGRPGHAEPTSFDDETASGVRVSRTNNSNKANNKSAIAN